MFPFSICSFYYYHHYYWFCSVCRPELPFQTPSVQPSMQFFFLRWPTSEGSSPETEGLNRRRRKGLQRFGWQEKICYTMTEPHLVFMILFAKVSFSWCKILSSTLILFFTPSFFISFFAFAVFFFLSFFRVHFLSFLIYHHGTTLMHFTPPPPHTEYWDKRHVYKLYKAPTPLVYWTIPPEFVLSQK